MGFSTSSFRPSTSVRLTANFINIILLCFSLILCEIPVGSVEIFTNTFVVKFHQDSRRRPVRDLVQLHGFQYLDYVGDGIHHIRLKWIYQLVKKSRFKRRIEFGSDNSQPIEFETMWTPNDPYWTSMWYLKRQFGPTMKVREAWALGYTGRNVSVTILDDGIERDHPDLLENYDPYASYDINDNDFDPTPRYNPWNENRHGTRCAGEVAAAGNNRFCNIGVAYKARIGGVRMLDGDVTDAVEARAVSYNRGYIDVYGASWGPDDDGRSVDGPGPLTKAALAKGVKTGRNGLGSIFIWANGNGGVSGDDCNTDGYTTSIYTMSIGSTSESGRVPWYAEPCSSLLAVTYSSGNVGENSIVTTDLRRTCTTQHSGSSASAPMAAGISALALEANPQLSWRDLQHIVVLTSRKTNLISVDWKRNGANLWTSHFYGFGLMDAEAMVRLAANWTSVPDQIRCELIADGPLQRDISPHRSGTITIEVGKQGSCTANIAFVEHVVARVTIDADRRGDLELYLTSPMGTKSRLLGRRIHDLSDYGFDRWDFMSTHFWGEKAQGLWQLELRAYNTTAVLRDYTLMVHGIDRLPESYPDLRLGDPSDDNGQFFRPTTLMDDHFWPVMQHDNKSSTRSSSSSTPMSTKSSSSTTKIPPTLTKTASSASTTTPITTQATKTPQPTEKTISTTTTSTITTASTTSTISMLTTNISSTTTDESTKRRQPTFYDVIRTPWALVLVVLVVFAVAFGCSLKQFLKRRNFSPINNLKKPFLPSTQVPNSTGPIDQNTNSERLQLRTAESAEEQLIRDGSPDSSADQLSDSERIYSFPV